MEGCVHVRVTVKVLINVQCFCENPSYCIIHFRLIPYDQLLKIGAVRGGLSVSAGIPGRFSCSICVVVKSKL